MSVPERSYHSLRRDRLLALGLCIDCGREPHTATAKRCPACGKKLRARGVKHWEKIKKERVDSGTRYEHAPEGGMGFGAIAKELGISRQAAQATFYRALSKFRAECVRRGIDASSIIGKGFSSLALCERWA